MKQKHWQVSVFDKTSEIIRDDTFYTTDTEAYLVFELIDEDFTPDSATVTVYNIYGKATINASVEIADGIVRYEMPEEAIGHPGGWRTQVIYTKDNEDYTTKIIEFDVGGHLLDNKKPAIVDIENWNSFIAHAGELIDDWEQLEEIRQANDQQRELAESARQNEFEANETSRQTNELVREEAENNRQSTFEISESARQANELTRESAESERVSNEEERISNESERIESEVARKEEMEKARYSRFSNNTYNEIGERLDTIESNTFTSHIFDKSGAPGPKSLLRGNEEAGFFGFVQPEEMGELLGNPEDNQEFSGVNLATAVGITQGTAINSNTPWMKFISNGEIIFVPVKPLRYSVSWASIYNAGAVYGDGTIGVTPPSGRSGNKLSVDGANSSFLIEPSATDEGFLRSGAVFGSVGDVIVTRGFANEENNGEFVISEITDTAIKVNATLFTEPKGHTSASIYKRGEEATQDAEVAVGEHKYKVRLLKGASQDPLNSYSDADRGLIGPDSEWNSLILPLHEEAKLGDWAYESFAGTVEDWGVGLTDKDLVTHNTLGSGSYSWMQETSDVDSYRRVLRGHNGASFGNQNTSWYVGLNSGWRPVLQLSII